MQQSSFTSSLNSRWLIAQISAGTTIITRVRVTRAELSAEVSNAVESLQLSYLIVLDCKSRLVTSQSIFRTKLRRDSAFSLSRK